MVIRLPRTPEPEVPIEIMINYRLSYWKTTLLAAFGTASLLGILSLWLIRKQIVILEYTWTFEENPLLFWLTVLFCAGIAIFSLSVALGGFICLYNDAKQNVKS